MTRALERQDPAPQPLLDQAIARIRQLSEEKQEVAAELLLAFIERDEPTYRVTPEQWDEVDRTMRGLEDGTVRIATDDEVEDMRRRFGL